MNKKIFKNILFFIVLLFVFLACNSEKEVVLNNPENSNSQVGSEIKNKGFVVVDFWAEWCGPCKEFGPIFEKVAQIYKGKIEFIRINVDNSRDIAKKYNISAIPTIVFINNGEEIDRNVGALDEQNFISKLKSNFKI